MSIFLILDQVFEYGNIFSQLPGRDRMPELKADLKTKIARKRELV